MNSHEKREALDLAVQAARAAGRLMNKNFRSPKKVNEETQFDIKLDLDVRCQRLISRTLRRRFPGIALLGEEGIEGDADADYRWVVDPIDGTVNFTYQIPHSCVSIALQQRIAGEANGESGGEDYQSVLGVVYDPFADELWTGVRGRRAFLNGHAIHVSTRRRLGEAVVSVGFSKQSEGMEEMLPVLNALIRKVRKIRVMGAAALAMTYVASGRFDAYVESNIRLWDIAAGGLILECAGGEFWRERCGDDYRYRINANNGVMRKEIDRLKRSVQTGGRKV